MDKNEKGLVPPIYYTTEMVMLVALLALSVGKPTLRCTIASIAEDSCALIVSMRINCWVQHLKDTKSRQLKTLKKKITKQC